MKSKTSLLLLFLAGCPKPAPEPAIAPVAPVAPSVPPEASVAVDDSTDCTTILRDLRGHWGRMHTAAEASGPTLAFAEAWTATPPTCRGGTWHLLAAKRIRESKAPLAADAAAFATPREALAAGLAAEPSHGPLLAFIAFGTAVSPDEFPPLPADACDRAAGDDHDYVCGMVALREARFADASNHFDAIRDLLDYPDATLRKRQAYLGAGKRPPPTAPTTAAQRESHCAKFGATPQECGKIVP